MGRTIFALFTLAILFVSGPVLAQAAGDDDPRLDDWWQQVEVNPANGDTVFSGNNPNGNNGNFWAEYSSLVNYPPFGGYHWELSYGGSQGYVRYFGIDLRGYSTASYVRVTWKVRGKQAGGAKQFINVNNRANWVPTDPVPSDVWQEYSRTFDASAFYWDAITNWISIGSQGSSTCALCWRMTKVEVVGAVPIGTPQSIQLNRPNGGESWMTGLNYSIEWTATNIPTVRIDYSIDGGGSWDFVDNASSSPYNWTVPYPPSHTCRVKVSDADDRNPYDISDANFEIAGFTVTSPNGGESWPVGSQQNITWNWIGGMTLVDIYYSTNGGTSWNLIVDNQSNTTGTYPWEVEGSPSTTCLIKIQDGWYPETYDVSNGHFTIYDANPHIWVYPTEVGVTIYQNQTEDINLVIGNSGGSNLSWNLAEVPEVIWLSESRRSGNVPAGGQTNVTVHLNPAGRSPGNYHTTLRITSNDPTRPTYDIPISMIVVVPGPASRVLRVTNDGQPVAQCSVYVRKPGQQTEFKGFTNSRGELSIDGIQVGDSVWAVKKIYTEPAVKWYHHEVDDIMFELWMDSKGLSRTRGDSYDWLPDVVVTTSGSIELSLDHPIFKWNLVVSTEWALTDVGWEDIERIFNKASDWFYNVSDGQMMLNKVAVYDSKRNWDFADIIIHSTSKSFAKANVAHFDVNLNSWWPYGIRSPIVNWFGKIETSRGRLEGLRPHTAIIHEMGHYALAFYDEYLDGHGSKVWPYREEYPDEFPGNYGLMQTNWEEGVTEMSSWYLYLESYPPDPDRETVTHHFYTWRLPCWETMERFFGGSYDGIQVAFSRVNVLPPSRSHLHGQSTARRGPETNAGCAVIRCDESFNGFEAVITAKFCGDSSVSGVQVYVNGNRWAGATDSTGSVLVVDLRAGDILEAYGSKGLASCHGRVEVERREPSYGILLEPILGSSEDDSVPPGILAELLCQGDTVHTLEIVVYASESLAPEPQVVVFPDGRDSLIVAMRHIGDRTYSGFASVESSRCGKIRVVASDTAGNICFSLNPYALERAYVQFPNVICAPSGELDVVLPDSSMSADRTLSILLCTAPPIPHPGGRIQVGGTYGFRAASGVNQLDDSAAMNFTYDDYLVSGIDETSLSFHVWNATGRSWSIVPTQREPGENVVSAKFLNFGIYTVFAVASDDTVPPERVNDLAACVAGGRGRVRLAWTAPGDDSSIGQATAYDIRFSSDSITSENWDSCQTACWTPAPSVAGSPDSIVLSLPEPGVDYYFAIKAMDEASNTSELSNVASVQALAPPQVPEPYLPANSSYIDDTTPRFWWSATLGDTGIYRLQYALDPEFTQGLVTIDSLDTNAYTVPLPQALEEGVWYWRVCAVDEYGNTCGYQIPPYQFTVDVHAPEPPVRVWPGDNGRVGTLTPRFLWTASGGDWSRHTLQVSADSLLTDSVLTFEDIYDTTFKIPDSLALVPTRHYWRVKAFDGAGNKGEYQVLSFRFTVDTVLPQVPFLLSPVDSAVIHDSLPTFVWSTMCFAAETEMREKVRASSDDIGPKDIPGSGQEVSASVFVRTEESARSARRSVEQEVTREPRDIGSDRSFRGPVAYTLQIAHNDSFVPCAVETTGIADTVLPLPSHLSLSDSAYFWRVEAVDSFGNHSGYPDPWLFRVKTRSGISGNVGYYFNQNPVESVNVCLSGYAVDTVLTDNSGHYALQGLLMFQDYLVGPYRINSQRSGAVSSFDAAMVLQHVVHIDTLDSLQFIAGDVSGTGGVSSYDAGLILQYAVGMRDHFPVGHRPGLDSVDWAFRPPSREYDLLISNQLGQDYKGILYGDPSGNWPAVAFRPTPEVPGEEGTRWFCVNVPVPERPATESSIPVGPIEAPLAVGAKAATGPSIGPQVMVVTDEKGEESTSLIIFSVTASNATDMVSADMLVRYDVRRFTLNAIRTAQETEGFMVAAVDRSGEVRIGMAGTRKLNGDVVLLEMLFEPRGDFLPINRPLPVEVCWIVLNENFLLPERGPEGTMGDRARLPKVFFLGPPVPNPFGSGTCISYGLPLASDVGLCVFDAAGRKVRTLVDRAQSAGRYSVTWKGKNGFGRRLPNGIYFVRMQTRDFRFERKVVLLNQ